MRFKRNIQWKLQEALSTSPAVLLTGARQTGKTTLVEEYAKDKGYHYVTFDDLTSMFAAESDPKGFIEGPPKPVILDEVQRTRSFWPKLLHSTFCSALAILINTPRSCVPLRFVLLLRLIIL